MTVTRLRWNGQAARLAEEEYRGRDGAALRCERDPDLARLVEVCVLCNDAQTERAGYGRPTGSSTETALLELADRLGGDVGELREAYPGVTTVERASGRRYMATYHRGDDGETLIAVKGDPMAVLALCTQRSEHGELHALDTPRATQSRPTISRWRRRDCACSASRIGNFRRATMRQAMSRISSGSGLSAWPTRCG